MECTSINLCMCQLVPFVMIYFIPPDRYFILRIYFFLLTSFNKGENKALVFCEFMKYQLLSLIEFALGHTYLVRASLLSLLHSQDVIGGALSLSMAHRNSVFPFDGKSMPALHSHEQVHDATDQFCSGSSTDLKL